jgi:SAM-dependent methyltransferase
MGQDPQDQNIDQEVIDGFGREWATFDYSENVSNEALDAQFARYCTPIDLNQFDPDSSIAGDFGAGSGRWASRLVPYFSCIYAIEPSDGAYKVLIDKFDGESHVKVLKETVGTNSISNDSLDLALSLGVLHHIPDTGRAMQDIARKVKPGGTFLCYLYYSLENKPVSYRVVFWISNSIRLIISRIPYIGRMFITSVIAATIYLPLSRLAKLMENKGRKISNFPLHQYRDMPFVMLQNDALDRFGTRLEQRFSKEEIAVMVEKAGFDLATLKFSQIEPFWTFAVKK